MIERGENLCVGARAAGSVNGADKASANLARAQNLIARTVHLAHAPPPTPNNPLIRYEPIVRPHSPARRKCRDCAGFRKAPARSAAGEQMSDLAES